MQVNYFYQAALLGSTFKIQISVLNTEKLLALFGHNKSWKKQLLYTFLEK